MKRVVWGVVIGVIPVLLMPCISDAATTVGSSLRTRANLYVRCSSICTAAQSARPGGAGLTITADGVITRWRVRAATLGQVRLRVLRRESSGGYTSIYTGDWVNLDRRHAPGQDVLYEFPARVPVQAGELIALDRDPHAGGIFHTYGTNTAYSTADFSPGLSSTANDLQPTSSNPGRELLMNADIEKDGDGDGFGDETQDNCPTIPNDQTDKPCTTPTPTGTSPQEPSSTTIGTTPHTQGSEGPPVQGEDPATTTERGHGGRPAARAAPPRPAGDGQRAHGRRVGARAQPPKPNRRESDTHSSRPGARPQPVSRPRHTSQHSPAPSRPAPPATHKPAAQPHDQTPARPAPQRKRTAGTRRHGAKHTRPAPQPQPAPGWQHH